MRKKLNLEPMFSPKSITVIGASGDPGKISARPLHLIRNLGYEGSVYPVHARHNELEGYPCYENFESLPEDIDMAIISIRASAVLPALEELAKKSIKSAVVFSSGFAEAGDDGRELQQNLTDFVERTGIPVVGPNSIGFFNLKDKVVASFQQIEATNKDPIAFVTQSGAFGTIAYRMLEEMGVGLQYFVSSGNEAGIDFFDYVHYFAEQEEIEVIGGYIEGARDMETMDNAIRLCQENDKPLILFKVGTTELGATAAISHTASIAGNASIYSNYFEANNVVQVDDEEELIDTINLFHKAKKSPKRGGTAIVTISGGAGIVMADKCVQYDVEFADLAPETITQLKEILPPFASVKNPIDVTAQFIQNLDHFSDSINILLKDDAVESVVLYMQILDAAAPVLIPEISKIANETDKTFVVCWAGASDQTKELLSNSGICWLPSASRSIRALKNLMHYNKRKDLLSEQKGALEERVTDSLELEAFGGGINEHRGKSYLDKYGIPIPKGDIAENVEEAVKLADTIGYPVVLKVLSQQIAHKTEADVIKINVKSAEEVRRTFEEIMSNALKYDGKAKIDGIIVEEMVEDGVEVMIGSIQDPLFGPSIVLSLGGIFVEVFNDSVIKQAPLNIKDAKEMIQSIKGYEILKGIRNKGPYDIQALAETIVKVSELSVDQKDWLHELDINPVMVHEEGKGVTALDALFVGEQKLVSLSH